MYKVPHKFIGMVMPNPEIDYTKLGQFVMVSDILDTFEDFGGRQYGTNSLLCVKYLGRYWISTFYWLDDKRDAQFQAAENGFPFIADDNDRPIKVGLLARLFRSIIA